MTNQPSCLEYTYMHNIHVLSILNIYVVFCTVYHIHICFVFTLWYSNVAGKPWTKGNFLAGNIIKLWSTRCSHWKPPSISIYMGFPWISHIFQCVFPYFPMLFLCCFPCCSHILKCVFLSHIVQCVFRYFLMHFPCFSHGVPLFSNVFSYKCFPNYLDVPMFFLSVPVFPIFSHVFPISFRNHMFLCVSHCS